MFEQTVMAGVGHLSDTGNLRRDEPNQDSYRLPAYATPAQLKQQGWLFVVADGDGMNQSNKDNAFDTVGRATAQPLHLAGYRGFADRLQIGASFYSGFHHKVGYALPALKTQGGFTFLDMALSKAGYALAPEGADSRYAFELSSPLGARFEIQAEWVVISRGVTEQGLADGKLSGTGHDGTLSGSGGYVELSYWAWGARSIIGANGIQPPPRLNLAKTPPQESGLQLVAKGELATADVTLTNASTKDPIPGHYAIRGVQLGVNYWMTKHVRLSADYAFYKLGDGSADDKTLLPEAGMSNVNELLARAALVL